MSEPLTVEKLAEALDQGRPPTARAWQRAALARAVWPLVREALDAERLAAITETLGYSGEWVSAGRWLSQLSVKGVRASEHCPVCGSMACDDDCPLAPIRNRQEPTDD
jgi:hypothetical protein